MLQHTQHIKPVGKPTKHNAHVLALYTHLQKHGYYIEDIRG